MYKGCLGGLGTLGGCFGVFFMMCDAFLDMNVYCGPLPQVLHVVCETEETEEIKDRVLLAMR